MQANYPLSSAGQTTKWETPASVSRHSSRCGSESSVHVSIVQYGWWALALKRRKLVTAHMWAHSRLTPKPFLYLIFTALDESPDELSTCANELCRFHPDPNAKTGLAWSWKNKHSGILIICDNLWNCNRKNMSTMSNDYSVITIMNSLVIAFVFWYDGLWLFC